MKLGFTLRSVGFLFVLSLIAFYSDHRTVSAQSDAAPEPDAPSAVYTGTGLGAIPDSPGPSCGIAGAAKDVSFTVSGTAGVPANVQVNMILTHSWVGDLTATLIAPNGTTQAVLFGRTGLTAATGCGDDSNLAGPYDFLDSAVNSWWQAATAANATTAVAAGSYRSSNSGGAGAVNPQPPTNLTATFSGIGNANGVWTLRLTDSGPGDTGSITAASLTLTGLTSTYAPHDINGDARSDFSILRADVPVSLMGTSVSGELVENDKGELVKPQPSTGQSSDAPNLMGVTWYTSTSDQVPYSTFIHGLDTDYFMTANMVGDNKSDLVVWRPGTGGNSGFYIMNANTGVVTFRPFGQTGDIATILGDFDGDGKFDLTIARGQTNTPGGNINFYWAPVNNPANFTVIPWGVSTDIAFTLDYDGDGKSDVAVQRDGGGNVGQFWIRKSSDGSTEVVNNYGFATDFLVPGDYDGDGRDDLCVSRTTNNLRYYFPRSSATGNVTFIQWGIVGDVRTPGDYDGDGVMDFAVWRPGTPNGTFYVMKSTGGFQTFVYGKTGDVPLNSWNVH